MVTLYIAAAAEPANVAVEEEEPKAPVIIEQPLEKIIAVVGEDLKLPLKVKGEPPLRCVLLHKEYMCCNGPWL